MDDPPSPCTGICGIEEASGRCAGCSRTLAQIAAWSTLSAEAKRNILASLAADKLQ
ncbi:MAG: DUF1289 domain-containing protein [Novosphingobium sp.]|nr:DUF1289 domain-containing protein [Novosphingobium sp.]